MAKTLSVSITIGPSTVRAQLSEDMYKELIKKVAGKEDWIKIVNADGAELNLNRKEVLAVKAVEAQEFVGKAPGITVKDICKVAPTKWNYVTLVRKVNKPKGIQLEMLSERRIALTEKNISQLKLSKDEVIKLKAIERKRIDK
ncbi:MAG: hypothetical protein IPK68_10020 [Bdellovibrionales bacterium]|nr:hypothetical protein [Bdellovibrionales bacterium]